MHSTPFDYLRATSPRSWRLPGRGLILIAAFVVLASPFVTVRQDESRMDAVTGSISSKTVWLFGITTRPRVDASPLETRLKSSGITWTPAWVFLSNTHRTVFGTTTCNECGSTPAIAPLHSMLKEFATGSTDPELREFVRVMQFGTDARRRTAIDAAAGKTFGN